MVEKTSFDRAALTSTGPEVLIVFISGPSSETWINKPGFKIRVEFDSFSELSHELHPC